MALVTFTEGGSDGALNGTTAVTIVAAPASLTRRIVKSIHISNRDTASVTLTLRLVDGGNTRVLIPALTLAVGDILVLDEMIILDSTSKSITALLSGAPATTNPDWSSSWGDVSG